MKFKHLESNRKKKKTRGRGWKFLFLPWFGILYQLLRLALPRDFQDVDIFSKVRNIFYSIYTLTLTLFLLQKPQVYFCAPSGYNQAGHVSSAVKAVNRYCLISWSSSSFPVAITATTSQYHCCTKSSSSSYHLYHSTFLQAPPPSPLVQIYPTEQKTGPSINCSSLFWLSLFPVTIIQTTAT